MPEPGSKRAGVTRRREGTWQASKSEQTRARLIDAAVDCIADLGYTAATTDRIARAAGVTRGPLQYYFSDRSGLILAVFERLHRQIMNAYAEATRGARSSRDFIEAMLEVNYAWCRSPTHYAMLEIMIASRSDPALAARLEPLMRESNEAVDAHWSEHFASDLPRDQLIAARYVMVALMRGLAINSLTFRDPELFEREFEMVRRMAMELVRRPKQ